MLTDFTKQRCLPPKKAVSDLRTRFTLSSAARTSATRLQQALVPASPPFPSTGPVPQNNGKPPPTPYLAASNSRGLCSVKIFDNGTQAQLALRSFSEERVPSGSPSTTANHRKRFYLEASTSTAFFLTGIVLVLLLELVLDPTAPLHHKSPQPSSTPPQALRLNNCQPPSTTVNHRQLPIWPPKPHAACAPSESSTAAPPPHSS